MLRITTGLTLAGLCALTVEATAQTAPVAQPAQSLPVTTDATVLPRVVVEGATLEAKPVVKRRKAESEDETPPAPKPKRQPSANDDDAQPTPKNNAAVSGSGQAAPSPSPGSAAASGAAGSAAGSQSAGNAEADAGGVTTDRLGVSVTVVTGEDLRRQQIRYAADALRSLPGVEVNRTSTAGSATEVRIRGAEAYHTSVRIDGIDVKDPSTGEFDFSDLSTEDIEQIEVIRGPSSGIYGANAIGGVINIITKRGRGPLTVTAKTEFGAFGTKDVSVGLSGGDDKANVAVSYHTRENSGFNISPFGGEKDGSKLATFSFKGGVMVMDNVALDVVVRNTRKLVDRDGFGGPPGALATAVDEASHSSNTTWLGGLNLKVDMLDGKLTHQFHTDYKSTDLRDYDLSVNPGFSQGRGETFTYSYLATYRFATPELLAAKHSLSGFVEKQDESFYSVSKFPDPFFPTFIDGPTHRREQLATAGEYRGEFAKMLDVTAAYRHDAHDNFIDYSTWRTSASLRLPEGLRPHGSLGTGVRLPTMFQQFGFDPNFFRGNPNLQPESSRGWDGGLEWTVLKGKAVLDATYFHSYVTNRITLTGFPSTPINLPGLSIRQGVELSGRFQLLPPLTLGLAYTYLDATNPNGLQETRRPPNAGRIDLNYAFDRGRGNIRAAAVYNGDMKDIAFRVDQFGFTSIQERVTLNSYWNVTLAASYEVSRNVEVFGRVENLLNQHYQEVYGFNTAGIAAYAGVKVKLSVDDVAKLAKD